MKFKTLARKMKNGQNIDFAKMAEVYQPLYPIAIDENFPTINKYIYDGWNCLRETHTIEFLDGSHCEFYIGWMGEETKEYDDCSVIYANIITVMFIPNTFLEVDKIEYLNKLVEGMELYETIFWDDEDCENLSKDSISEEGAEEKIWKALNDIINRNAKLMTIPFFFDKVTSIKDKDESEKMWEELKCDENLSKTDIEVLKKAAAEFKKQLNIKKDF